MPGPAPKPDSDRRRRNEPTFEWVDLPTAGRQGPAPAMPDGDYAELADWWADLWASPQAAAWDQSGRSLHGYLECKRLLTAEVTVVTKSGEAVEVPAANPTTVLTEMRQIEDRHGLNPKAMLALRWRIVDDEVIAAKKPTKKPTRRRDPRLSVVRGGKGA